MIKIIVTLSILLFQFTVSSQSESDNNNPQYDSELTKKLRGDNYDMKSCYRVIIKTGINTEYRPKTP